MRSGFVRLKPGATVGWHTTGQNEESLVILRGQGEALIDGQEKQTFAAPAFAYIPPNTRHNVSNTGKEYWNTFTWLRPQQSDRGAYRTSSAAVTTSFPCLTPLVAISRSATFWTWAEVPCTTITSRQLS